MAGGDAATCGAPLEVGRPAASASGCSWHIAERRTSVDDAHWGTLTFPCSRSLYTNDIWTVPPVCQLNLDCANYIRTRQGHLSIPREPLGSKER